MDKHRTGALELFEHHLSFAIATALGLLNSSGRGSRDRTEGASRLIVIRIAAKRSALRYLLPNNIHQRGAAK